MKIKEKKKVKREKKETARFWRNTYNKSPQHASTKSKHQRRPLQSAKYIILFVNNCRPKKGSRNRLDKIREGKREDEGSRVVARIFEKEEGGDGEKGAKKIEEAGGVGC